MFFTTCLINYFLYNTCSHSCMDRLTMSLHVYFGRTNTYGKSDSKVNLLSLWSLCKDPSACNTVFSLTNPKICCHWYSKELFFLSLLLSSTVHLIFYTCLPLGALLGSVNTWPYSACLCDLIRSEVDCSLSRVVGEEL